MAYRRSQAIHNCWITAQISWLFIARFIHILHARAVCWSKQSGNNNNNNNNSYEPRIMLSGPLHNATFSASSSIMWLQFVSLSTAAKLCTKILLNIFFGQPSTTENENFIITIIIHKTLNKLKLWLHVYPNNVFNILANVVNISALWKLIMFMTGRASNKCRLELLVNVKWKF